MSPTASGQPPASQTDAPQFESDPAKGRDFREISVHPNGEELLFVECSRALEPAGGCYVLRYHLTRKSLQRYVLPEQYFYTSASFSPQGNYVVMSRVPRHDSDQESVQHAYDKTEIALMKSDGTEFGILQLAKGPKVGPNISLDGRRVAYWRAALRKPASRTFSNNFDVWEMNLSTGEDRLFAGPFLFYERDGLQYLSQDEMVVGAYGPVAFLRQHAQSMTTYDKKYNRSGVYRFSRGAALLPEPICTEVEGAKIPSIDKDGNVYFYGQRPGISLFKRSMDGHIKQWVKPQDIGGISSMVASSDGLSILFTYHVRGTQPREAKEGMGMLDTSASGWKAIDIPSLERSDTIPVMMTK